MSKVVIDMTMSLDGFVAGPGDGKDYPLGKNDGMRSFDWYFSGKEQYRNPLFRPEPNEPRSGQANVRGIRSLHLWTADLRHHEWLGWRAPGERRACVRAHPHSATGRNGAHWAVEPHLRDRRHRGAIRQARAVMADGKDIKLGGASPGQQALRAGMCDEILIHLVPYGLGDGVRLLDHLDGPLRLEKISATDGPLAAHLRYRVVKERSTTAAT